MRFLMEANFFFFFLFVPAMRFEPGTARYRARRLPLCYITSAGYAFPPRNLREISVMAN